ncbi:ABC transporter permease [Oceanicoccus sagamiensis]|nr:ABC transporter permease [Oceanicoccus sagamiensis]
MSLKAEASKNYLGLLWWVIEPTLYLGVFYFVFGMGFRQGGEGFLSYLLCGLVVWKWFDASIKACTVSITQNVGIMYQLYLPKLIFPAIAIVAASFRFIFILAIFLAFLLLTDTNIQASWLWLPLLLLVQMYFIVAVGFLVAAIVPLIPDLRLVVNYVMLMLFFSSGIFFDISLMDERVRDILAYNPFLMIINFYRSVLLSGTPPAFNAMAGIALFSTVLTIINLFIYKRFDRVYPRLAG